MTEKFQKLVDANIELLPLPEISTHFVFQRDGFVALVDRVRDDFGKVGTAGLLTERGIAPLVWRQDDAFFVLKDFSKRRLHYSRYNSCGLSSGIWNRRWALNCEKFRLAIELTLEGHGCTRMHMDRNRN